MLQECNKCGIEKDLHSCFYRSKGYRKTTGYLKKCKECIGHDDKIRQSRPKNTPASKICSSCKIEKLASEYYLCNRHKDGLRCACKKCTNESGKRSRIKHPDTDKVKHARWKYGLSEAEYKCLLHSHNYCCAICKSTKTLCIDHDHVTTKVRGLLCRKCNASLGMLNDNIDLFKSAISYLKKHKK